MDTPFYSNITPSLHNYDLDDLPEYHVQIDTSYKLDYVDDNKSDSDSDDKSDDKTNSDESESKSEDEFKYEPGTRTTSRIILMEQPKSFYKKRNQIYNKQYYEKLKQNPIMLKARLSHANEKRKERLRYLDKFIGKSIEELSKYDERFQISVIKRELDIYRRRIRGKKYYQNKIKHV